MKITNLKELNKRKTLELGDEVEFHLKDEVIEYEVKTWFLSSYDHDNDFIFTKLELDGWDLAEKYYGYTAGGGCWPNARHSDYEALTRLVKRLYEIIERKEPIKSRFEILDIR